MRVIGVVDLAGGRAVHARAGKRQRYEPVRAVTGSLIEPGDALALAHAYLDRLGLTELYIADLDAILGSCTQDAVVTGLTALGAPVLLDAGVSTIDRARHARRLGASQVVVALETLSSFGALKAICNAVGGPRVAFSLDVRAGVPVVAAGSAISGAETPHRLAQRAVDSGAGTIILIDVARVGTGMGLDLPLVARVRKAAPEAALLAGGGVRGPDDLEQLAEGGCDGVLVATAVQDGRVTAAHVAAARHYRAGSRL